MQNEHRVTILVIEIQENSAFHLNASLYPLVPLTHVPLSINPWVFNSHKEASMNQIPRRRGSLYIFIFYHSMLSSSMFFNWNPFIMNFQKFHFIKTNRPLKPFVICWANRPMTLGGPVLQSVDPSEQESQLDEYKAPEPDHWMSLLLLQSMGLQYWMLRSKIIWLLQS